jgi:hypothetical protein
MNTKRIALLAPLAALALAACGGNTDEAQQPGTETNLSEDTAAPVNMTEVPTEAPPATRIDNANTESQPAPAEVAPEQQTQDDADATGMTARVSRDEGGNESGQPAQ